MKILRSVVNGMAEHAGENLPDECCGVLLAETNEPGTLSRIIPAENTCTKHRSSTYMMGHRAHLTAVQLEAAGKANIAGYYHSHPSGTAHPSKRDAELAIDNTLYLIAVPNERDLRAWRFREKEFVSEPLEVIE